MVNLHDKKLMVGSLGALGVIAGVVIKNSLEQMKMEENMVGPIVFVAGWLAVMHSIVTNNNGSLVKDNKSYGVMAAIVCIVVAVFMMKKLMKEGKEMNMMYPAMFAGSWLLLGYLVGHYGLVASILVLASMMKLLPTQRKECIVDGPGMPMFVVAWAVLVYSNSIME